MFIKGISYWSFPGGFAGTKPVREAFVEARKAGYESIEVCLSETGDVSLETTELQAKSIQKAAVDAGIRISSVACGLFWSKSLTANDPMIRTEALEIGKKLIDVAHWLDAGAVLVIPGAVDVFFDPASEVIDCNVVYQRSTEAIESLLPNAEAAQITLGIENVWNKFLVGPHEYSVFIDQFQSKWVKAYFDVGNCMPFGYPEQWIKHLGKRITRVHLKDFKRGVGTVEGFCDLLAGDVNWPAVMTALEEIGYNGFLTAEMGLYRHHPEVVLDNTSRAMDAMLGRNV
jgi:L-ribulose-5-phosphate 3-epimerase